MGSDRKPAYRGNPQPQSRGTSPVCSAANASRSAVSSARTDSGLPAPWPTEVSILREHRGVAGLAALHLRGELEAVGGHDPVVVVAGQHQRRRVRRFRRQVVERGVRPQHVEHLRVVGGAVVGDPRRADREQVEAKHVQHPHPGQRDGREVRPLGHDRPDQQPTVAAAVQRELLAGGDAVGDQLLGHGHVVVEDVLLLAEPAAVVPGAAELATAAQVRHGEHASGGEPAEPLGPVPHHLGHVEAAVPPQHRRPRLLERHVGPAHQEVRHRRPVLARRAAPLGHQLGRLPPRGPARRDVERAHLATAQVQPVRRARLGQRRDAEEHLVASHLAVQLHHLSAVHVDGCRAHRRASSGSPVAARRPGARRRPRHRQPRPARAGAPTRGSRRRARARRRSGRRRCRRARAVASAPRGR